MHCTTCDTPNATDARFCTGCGAALAPAAGTATAPLSPPPPATAPLAAAAAPAAVTPTMPANPAFNQTINVNVQAAPPTPVVVMAPTVAGPGCLVRTFYFLFIGLWLGAL